ncbi:MAG: hypothetical protein P8Z79_01330 [Sedimentisphaerales bacterium]|jgi:hypothetical protein
MNARKFLFYVVPLLFGGCVPLLSLCPLYTKEDVILNDKLLGVWVDDANKPETTWEFTRVSGSEKAYSLVFTDEEGKKGSFVAHLLKLQNKLYLDICPTELPCKPDDPNRMDWPYNCFFLIPAHGFMAIGSIEPQLKLRLAMESNLEDLLKKDPKAVKYVKVDDRLVLTATTKELQAFVLEHADDKTLFTDEVTLVRKDARTGKP